MRMVRIKTAELLKIVKENREQHRATFEEALEGYRKEAIVQLELMLEEARRGKRIRRSVTLIEPMDQTKDYDRVIRMLELTVDEEVDLTASEFAQYVQDDWVWKEQFAGSTMSYLASP